MLIDIAALTTMISAMQGQRALVVGDVMLDRFVDGEVKRISPEAPVPVLSKSHMRQMPGGAANVACNMAHLGLDVTLIGVIGDDDAGAALSAEILKPETVEFLPLIVTGRVTSLKTRFRSGGQQILRVDDETTDPIDHQWWTV